jgi:hypothetical protein
LKFAPICAEALLPRLPFQLASVTVTALPLWVQFPDQPWASVWLPA